MDTLIGKYEKTHKQYGRVVAGIVAVLLLIMLIYPLMTYQTPPPGLEGFAISFGDPEVGEGDNRAAAPTPEIEEETEEPPAEETEEVVEEVEEVVEEKQPEKVVEKVKPEKPKETKKRPEVIKNDNSEVKLAQAKKDREAKAKREAAAAAQKQKDLEAAEAKRKVAAAKAAAEAEAAALKAKRDAIMNENKVGSGSGTGSGLGDTGKPGNTGSQDGDKNSNNLDGVGEGNGLVNGFGNRGFKSPGKITQNFPEEGDVVIKVCANPSGKVISADYTVRGSSTGNPTLVKLAKSNAFKYKFDSADLDNNQCGTVTYKFRFQ